MKRISLRRSAWLPKACSQWFVSTETGERELTVMRWGLVPFWSKDGKASFSTINAKSETVATSPTFREAWKTRRCLVPADLFYEWQKLDEKAKQPFAIAP